MKGVVRTERVLEFAEELEETILSSQSVLRHDTLVG
jgi:hypothetical protein